MKQGAKDIAKQLLKKKLIAAIPAIAPFVLGVLGFVLVILAVVAPIAAAKESVSQAADNVGTFFERFAGFFSGNGWNTDEEAYFKLLSDESLGCKNSKIVTATIMYYYQVSPNSQIEMGKMPEEATDEEDGNFDEDGDNMYDEAEYPYGKMLPDLKRLIKKIKKGEDTYKKYVINKFLEKEPYSELLSDTEEDSQEREDKKQKIYEEMLVISESIECDENYFVSSGARCTFDIDNQEASDIKVQLLDCSTNQPIDSEELIDFEKYILGVVYQENSSAPDEAIKAQAVAARSYALSRGRELGYAAGIGKINNQDGEWILSIRACTADQAYCDPDKGCWSDATGGEYNYASNATIYSGENPEASWSRGPLAENSKIRELVNETVGQVLINDNSEIVYTPFSSDVQIQWTSMANGGSDYYEILKKQYSSAQSLASNCVLTGGGASGDFTNWKQCDSQWGSTKLGSKTICEIGCLATSVSIQIARSGTQIMVDNFNPGTFVSTISQHNGFDSKNNFNWSENSWVSIAPNFKLVQSNISLSGNRVSKANQIAEQIQKGYFPIVSVKNDGHWVAIDYVDGDNVYVFDPASGNTTGQLWPYYTVEGTKHMSIYKKTD